MANLEVYQTWLRRRILIDKVCAIPTGPFDTIPLGGVTQGPLFGIKLNHGARVVWHREAGLDRNAKLTPGPSIRSRRAGSLNALHFVLNLTSIRALSGTAKRGCIETPAHTRQRGRRKAVHQPSKPGAHNITEIVTYSVKKAVGGGRKLVQRKN